jgi:uncharacterized membrane protein YqgA involved in biofilm formation
VFIGFGTLVNIVTVIIGSFVGVSVGDRLNAKIREAMTNSLGLITAMVAVLTAADIANPALKEALGPGRPVLIVLVSLVVGSALGTAWHLEDRLENAGNRLKARFSSVHWPSSVRYARVSDREATFCCSRRHSMASPRRRSRRCSVGV